MKTPQPASVQKVVVHAVRLRAWLGLGWLLFVGLIWSFREIISPRMIALSGYVAFLWLAVCCSHNHRAIRWRTLCWGIGLQVALAWLLLRWRLPSKPAEMSWLTWSLRAWTTDDLGAGSWRPVFALFEQLGELVRRFLGFSQRGAEFVFGPLADAQALKSVFPEGGFIFACVALPAIIFVSAIFSVLYYLRVLPAVVHGLAVVMRRALGTSGAETLSAVANVFFGQTEAPLIIKPYVPRLTTSELLAVMSGGMATIAGGVMAVYIQMGADAVAILATSVMAAPCSLFLAKLVWPEEEQPLTARGELVWVPAEHRHLIDALARGASEGLQLALNVAAMLIAFLATLALIDALLAGCKPTLLAIGIPAAWLSWWPDPLSLAWILARLFYLPAFLLGVESRELPMVADLLGTKLVANEFVAYVKFTSPHAQGGYADLLSPQGKLLVTYALTGFANFGSIGIQLGGLGAMAPERRAELAALGGRALLVGYLATLMNACLAHLLM
ncbi:MAG: nucleoside permease [Planctomycetaceae bacterium]|nr:MAG: nucleoside permease [Planctomycetaceae bacterium]